MWSVVGKTLVVQAQVLLSRAGMYIWQLDLICILVSVSSSGVQDKHIIHGINSLQSIHVGIQYDVNLGLEA